MRTIALLITMLLPVAVRAQTALSFQAGYGSYSMSSMKSFQKEMLAAFPVDAKITTSFPSYWFYEVSAKWTANRYLLLGGAFNYGSTAGRIYYSDYSGEIGNDQLMNYYSFQMVLGLRKSFIGNKLTVDFDLRPGFTLSNLKLTSYLSLNNSGMQSSEDEFVSTNFTLQPTLTCSARFGVLGVNAFAGYHMTAAAGTFVSKDGTNSTSYKPDWSGYRAGGGVSLYIGKPGEPSEPKSGKYSIGLGAGLDYGGLGLNALAYPHPNFGLFAGVGYALAGIGYNTGIKIRTAPYTSQKASVYFTGMYGYNAVVNVPQQSSLSRFFYGTTLGAGIDLRKGSTGKGYWSFGLLVPLRDHSVDDYLSYLKSMGYETQLPLLPVAVSAGYKFLL